MDNQSGPLPSPGAVSPSTTFVQTDASAFKELVQRLTGPHEESSTLSSPTTQKATGVRRPAFKLQERRRQKLRMVKPSWATVRPMPLQLSSPLGLQSPSSASVLYSPSTDLSALGVNDKASAGGLSSELDEEAEEKAIKERRFYLHPSPRAYGTTEPELLNLFPLTSPSSSSRPGGP